MPSLSSILTASAVAVAVVTAAKPCPPLGPVLPAPQAPSRHEAVQTAVKALEAGLKKQTSGYKTSAVSIGVKSLHERKQLLNWHHTPPVYSGIGTEEVDENTIYRVGSVSKVFAALVALQNADIDLDASVLEYIPELRDPSNSTNGVAATPWEDVTVRSLMNHLSGIATDMTSDMAIFPSDAWAAMGLPEIPKGQRPTCSGIPPTEPCSKEDLLEGIARFSPTFLPQSSPSYSNTAFALLGMVVEAATGKKFGEAVKNSIFDVVDMDSSSFDGPVESFEDVGYVPPKEMTWNGTAGIFEAAGGMFSNTVDLIAFLEAIQKHKLLPEGKTKEWLKPQTHTSIAHFSVGAPWEILRSSNITSDGRLVDIYTKTGDLGSYHAIIGIVPDYDISISVLTGGPEVSSAPFVHSAFLSGVLQAILPAIEAAGRNEASRFEGTYSEESTNSTLVLTSDDGPGILIKEFQVRGFDVLNNYGKYNLATGLQGGIGEQPDELPPVDGRLYPTQRRGRGADDTTETAWRAIFDKSTEEEREQLESQLLWPEASCTSWIMLDRSAYNYLSLADFAVVEDRTGGVKAVKNRAFNVTLTKVRGSDDDGAGGDDSQNGGDGSAEDGSSGGGGMPGSSAGRITMMGTTATLIVPMLMAVLLS